MVPPPEAYNWSNIYGIAFKFQSDTNPLEVLSLNGSYAETVPLTAPEISTLFTSDAHNEGPRMLGPAPVTALWEAFCNNAHQFMPRNIQATEQAKAAGRHEAIAIVEFNINKWRFKHNWKTNDPANYFNSIYIDDNDTPTHTSADAVVTTSHSPGPSFSPHAIHLVPVQANNAVVNTPAPSALPPATHTSSSNVDAIVPSGTTALVCMTTSPPNAVATPLNSTAPNIPRYTWTWTYSPHSESVLFHRVRSDSFLHATSSSPPDQRRQEKSSIVTAPSVSPSAKTRFGHHSAPPCEPANFQWTFNPQNDTVMFHRLPKPATVPFKRPLRFPMSEAIPDGLVLSPCPPTTLQTTFRCPEDKAVPLACEHPVNELVLRYP
eukprot:jgi/Psemu1/1006/gm1.1006_g